MPRLFNEEGRSSANETENTKDSNSREISRVVGHIPRDRSETVVAEPKGKGVRGVA